MNKGEHVPSPALLQPIPELAWSDISMDLRSGLPQIPKRRATLLTPYSNARPFDAIYK